MAEYEAPPSFAGVKYDIGNVPNIGAGYAAGITEAGKGIAQGVSGALDVMNRNRTADDMLQVLQQNKILSPDAYQSVAGKGLQAKEATIGMFANQWIAQQAQQRDLEKIGASAAGQAAVEHAKLLDAYDAIRKGYPQAAGISPGKLQALPAAASGTTPMQPLTGANAPPLQTNLSGTPGTAAGAPGSTPLGSGAGLGNPQLITTPQLQAAQAERGKQPVTVVKLSPSDKVPTNAVHGKLSGQTGFLDAGANKFYTY